MYLTLQLEQAARGCKNFPEQRNFQEPIEKNYRDGTTCRADPVKVMDNEEHEFTMMKNRKTSRKKI
jgi:hypothetical protein